MNQQELVRAVADDTGLTQKQVKDTLNSMLKNIKVSLAQDDSVRIMEFGTFKKNVRAARVGRNPKTGESIEIPERTKVKFNPSESFFKYV